MKKNQIEIYEEISEMVRANATDQQKALLELSYQALKEVEAIYFGTPIYDAKSGKTFYKSRQDIDILHKIAESQIDVDYLTKHIKNMSIGEIFILLDEAYIKTPTNEFQEVGLYINRLEKALLAIQASNKTPTKKTKKKRK